MVGLGVGLGDATQTETGSDRGAAGQNSTWVGDGGAFSIAKSLAVSVASSTR